MEDVNRGMIEKLLSEGKARKHFTYESTGIVYVDLKELDGYAGKPKKYAFISPAEIDVVFEDNAHYGYAHFTKDGKIKDNSNRALFEIDGFKFLSKEESCKLVIIPQLKEDGISLNNISEELHYREQAGVVEPHAGWDDELVFYSNEELESAERYWGSARYDYLGIENAKELWSKFGDVPMNPETECIEEEWNGFHVGTFREEIWGWFEETFNISVAEDLMGVEKGSHESVLKESGSLDCKIEKATNKCEEMSKNQKETKENDITKER